MNTVTLSVLFSCGCFVHFAETQAEQDQEEHPARSAGAKAGLSDSEEPKGSGSGTVAGVVGAIGVAIVGAVSGYFAHQKKKLCFKPKERDPERAKEEEGAQNDPQVLSNLLNSS
uniref:CD99 molecule n=1 Tax=Astyanax mexicanus TaxID=7994 RepID=A0A8B9GNB2_ASTMX